MVLPKVYSTIGLKNESYLTVSNNNFDVPPKCRYCSLILLGLTSFKGKKTSRASCCCRKYSIHSKATDLSSTTIASMFLPRTLVIATVYFLCIGSIRSANLP
ncbi:hypothetical protein RF11_07614 [Thelohanellus kitauei]|uniref:Uncharacterized protein n=1 Tax=Thelohanellus kitauei TaxID=669202 RepID=A0A0C2NFR3_THEKT|nr:hypothetical protein RF11_07614 [Thelohanellus kitauei]